MIEIISNGSKWFGEKPDNIDQLIEVLKTQTLDPTFEKYGNFINKNPQWVVPAAKEQYKNCTLIWGNFLTYSHVFKIVTDEEDIINIIELLVNQNKKTKEYRDARKQLYTKNIKQNKHMIQD